MGQRAWLDRAAGRGKPPGGSLNPQKESGQSAEEWGERGLGGAEQRERKKK